MLFSASSWQADKQEEGPWLGNKDSKRSASSSYFWPHTQAYRLSLQPLEPMGLVDKVLQIQGQIRTCLALDCRSPSLCSNWPTLNSARKSSEDPSCWGKARLWSSVPFCALLGPALCSLPLTKAFLVTSSFCGLSWHLSLLLLGAPDIWSGVCLLACFSWLFIL